MEEETSHVCRCGSINSRVMHHPELNVMCPGPRPSFRPGPNEAFLKSFLLPLEVQGHLKRIGIIGRE